MTIKRLDPVSCAKISGLLNAIVGFLFGLLVAMVSLTGSAWAPDVPSGGWTRMFGAISVVVFPIAYGVIGFVVTFIGAAIYNGLAKLVGGVVIETE
jgi:hypothetical protein